MKKALLALLIFAGISQLQLSSQDYHPEDVAALKDLLRMQSPDGRCLFEAIHMNPLDTADWAYSNDWIQHRFDRPQDPNEPENPWRPMPEGFCRWKATDLKEEYPEYVGIKRLTEINMEVSEKFLFGVQKFRQFEYLEKLRIQGQEIQTLDVSENMHLKELDCDGNNITDLVLGYKYYLEVLKCSGNQLDAIDLAYTPALKELYCERNQLSSLNLSSCQSLKALYCYDNQLVNLSASPCSILESLYCQNNQLTNLNISACWALETLYCHDNQLTSLNLGNNVNLKDLRCYSNQLQSLDIYNCRSLEVLYCYWNKIASLDFRNSPNIMRIDCFMNQIQTLHLGENPKLIDLVCRGNKISSLNLTRCIELNELDCQTNLLTTLDISNCTKLTYLNGNGNVIPIINFQNNTELTTLSCQTRLTSIDLTKCTKLKTLIVSTNNIGSLDLSKCVNLEYLNCSGCGLTSLDLRNSPKLTFIDCSVNKLRYSTFKYNNSSNPKIYFTGQKDVEIEVQEGEYVDLSADFCNSGVQATWWMGYTKVYPQHSGNGKYLMDSSFAGKTLRCNLLNPYFVDGGQYYWAVKVLKKVSKLQDHLTIIDLPTPNTYSISTGVNFRVYANTTYSDDLSIGLFHQNGTFIQDIKTARSGNVFTCQIPSTVSGNYILSAYKLDEGVATPVLRENNSIFIDKLLLNVVRSYGTYSLGTLTSSSDIEIQQHMQIKTSANYLHFANTNQAFKVLANSTLPTDISIGLFSLDGVFVEDVTVSRSGNTFTCSVSDFIWDGDYVIIPYETASNGTKLVERTDGTQYIDRLPIYIEQDIWGDDWSFSATYPDAGETRNVSSIEELQESINNLEDKIESIDVYSTSGIAVKSVSNPESLYSINLNKGSYIAKVQTSRGTLIYKFIKK